jgi:hypothetical protein
MLRISSSPVVVVVVIQPGNSLVVVVPEECSPTHSILVLPRIQLLSVVVVLLIRLEQIRYLVRFRQRVADVVVRD